MTEEKDMIGKERIFISHVPGCVEAEPFTIRYSTWGDLENKLRARRSIYGNIGCAIASKKVMLLDVFDSDKGVQWWVIGMAYNGPEDPPWPFWKHLVRQLGGRV